MELDPGNIQRPVRILRRSLKSLTSDPPMAEVHNLRTHARRVEAIAAALMPGGKKQKQRLLKTIRPVRKAAGVVRDMDVLARNARTLARHRRNGSVARLLAYLSSMRLESARELFEAVAERRSDARRRLKRFSRQIEKRFHENKPQAAGDGPGTEAAMKLIRELNSWPGFSAENLHAFRIKMTELRISCNWPGTQTGSSWMPWARSRRRLAIGTTGSNWRRPRKRCSTLKTIARH